MKNRRCEAILIQLIVTTYDDHGRPVDEMVTKQGKVFRATALDFWGEADKAVKALVDQERQQAVAVAVAKDAAKAAKPKGKRNG